MRSARVSKSRDVIEVVPELAENMVVEHWQRASIVVSSVFSISITFLVDLSVGPLAIRFKLSHRSKASVAGQIRRFAVYKNCARVIIEPVSS